MRQSWSNAATEGIIRGIIGKYMLQPIFCSHCDNNSHTLQNIFIYNNISSKLYLKVSYNDKTSFLFQKEFERETG